VVRQPTDNGPTTCDSWYKFFTNFITCGARGISVYFSSAIIYLTGWLLGMAGVVFNWLLDYSVVNFDANIYKSVSTGITGAWTAFRDISNILIIGIFTFLAIEQILGTQVFGGKRMIANVLIVAILINFSLLFTRIIIGTSNFVSAQFYKAVSIQTIDASKTTIGGTSTGVGAAPGTESQFSAGVSGRFAQLMGIAGFGEARDALWKVAENPQGGWYVALLQGMLTAAVFVGASIVFLYGAFLMVARAILLIFLLMTSSLAFASYLLPKSFVGNYGWSAWWQSLLSNAAFAPLLIILIWATLKVGEGIKAASIAKAGGGSLGALLANPASSQGIGALFSYLIILGMLYASIRFASSFSKTIGGFDYAKMLPGIGLGIGGIAAGMFGRTAVGWPAARARAALRNYYNRPDEYDEEGNLIRSFEGRRTGIAGLANRAALRSAGRLGTATFNPLQSKAAQLTASTLGIPQTLMGKRPGEGGFVGAMERQARAAEQLARAIGPTDAQRGAIREAGERDAQRQRTERQQEMQQVLTQQRQQLATLQQQARESQPERSQADRELADAREAVRERERDATERQSRLRIAEQRASSADEATRRRGQAEAADILREMRTEGERIEAARSAVRDREQRIQALNALAERAPDVAAMTEQVRQAERNLEAFNRATRGAVTEAGRRAVDDRMVRLGQSLLWDPRAAGEVRGAMRSHQRDENLRRLRDLVNEGQTRPQSPAAEH
jgi:hypothetical protein